MPAYPLDLWTPSCRRLSVKKKFPIAGISVGSVDTVLHDEMKLRKVSGRWVQRKLTDEKKASRDTTYQAMTQPTEEISCYRQC